jgi:hypothetical protein
MIRRSAGLILVLLAAVSSGCADQNVKQMVVKPKPDATAAGGAPERKVVLFRAVVDVEGAPMEEPWSFHFSGLGLFTVVGPKGESLTARHSFLPGRPDVAASDAGWAFVALPPGTYQLAFEGTAIRFAMAGAQYYGSEAVPIGRSPPSGFVVPADAGLIYIGTFNFACHQPTGRPDALKLECTTLEIRDEAQEARKIAQTSLTQYGPIQEALASAPGTKLP